MFPRWARSQVIDETTWRVFPGPQTTMIEECYDSTGRTYCPCTASLSATGFYRYNCTDNKHCFGDICVTWYQKSGRVIEQGCGHYRSISIAHAKKTDICKIFSEELEERDDVQLLGCCCDTNCSANGTFTLPTLPTTLPPVTSDTLLPSIATPDSSSGGQVDGLAIASILLGTIIVLALIIVVIWRWRTKRREREQASPRAVGEYSIGNSTLGVSSGHGMHVNLEPRGLVKEIKIIGDPLGVGGYGQGVFHLSGVGALALGPKVGKESAPFDWSYADQDTLDHDLVNLAPEGESIRSTRFADGEVYFGQWRNRSVAVKRLKDERIFKWEHNLQSNWPLRHPNIVEFYGGDTEYDDSLTHHWIVTQYHALGSLQRYLKEDAFGRSSKDGKSPISSPYGQQKNGHPSVHVPLTMNSSADRLDPIHLSEMLRLLTSLASGLDHLHAYYPNMRTLSGHTHGQMYSIHKKPIIAHCDIKSQNVLVRDDLTCCITDFGHAVYRHPDEHTIHLPSHLETKGTNRYLPPEQLDNTADLSSLLTYMQQDSYSLALVLWEIAQCCPTSGRPHPQYHPPYYERLTTPNPTVQEVKAIVCDQGYRPHTPDDWKNCEVLQDLSAIMLSCWSATASERPTSNMIYQSLRKLESDCSDDSINSSHHENEHRTNRVETTGRQRQVRFTDMRDPSSSDNGDASHKNTLARQDSHTPILETSL